MKPRIAILAAGICAAAILAFAGSPTYVTKSATGTTLSTNIFASSANTQIRVVGAFAQSDKAGSVISFRTGTTPFTIGASNASGITLQVVSTNGMPATPTILIEAAAGTVLCTVSTVATNILTLAVASGIATVPGDQLYVMSAAQTLPVGSNTVNYQGEALFVGNSGRPVSVVVDGTSGCTNGPVTARYE
jgi:hypothetical protein